MSTAGDRPFFRGGIHNDPYALNDLATRVGMLEATRYLPPLQWQGTPAGALVSLQETKAAAVPPGPASGASHKSSSTMGVNGPYTSSHVFTDILHTDVLGLHLACASLTYTGTVAPGAYLGITFTQGGLGTVLFYPWSSFSGAILGVPYSGFNYVSWTSIIDVQSLTSGQASLHLNFNPGAGFSMSTYQGEFSLVKL